MINCRILPSKGVLCFFLGLFFLPNLVFASVYYQYDAKHRLTSVIYDNGVGITYSYDTAGNRTQKATSTTATPNAAPNIPTALLPADNAVDFSIIGVQLQWSGGDPNPGDSATYSVYFGDSTTPALLQTNYTDTTLSLPQLIPGTTYYWKVTAKDQYYMTSESPLFSFTTDPIPPHAPVTPTPADTGTTSYNNVTLSWDVDGHVGQTYSYDVEFGTTTTPSQISQDQTATNLALGTLAPNQEYYWRVVVTDSEGLKSRGPLWNFTTDPAGTTTFSSPNFKTSVTLKQSGSPYVVSGTLTIDSSGILTVEPGTVLKMMPNSSISVSGTLVAPGTPENNIFFTSYKNDTLAGDTNQDDNGTSPAPGDWYGITFNSSASSSSIMTYCVVDYAGYGNRAAVRVNGPSPTISNSNITNNKYYGIQVQGGTPVLDSNTITDNGHYGIYIASGTPAVTNNITTNGIYAVNNSLSELTGNTFTLTEDDPLHLPADYIGDLFANNSFSGTGYIEVLGGTITKDATWKNIVPLHILGTVTVKGTDGDDNITTLTIEPGTTIKMANNIRFIVGGTSGDPGALQAIGSSSDKITFTSADANPTAGKWYGIIFYNTTDSSTTLENCIIEYAGYGSYGAVYTYYSSPTIKNSIFRNNSFYGIRNNNGSPIIDGNTILNNGNYSVYSNAGQISLTNNTMDGGISIPNNGLTALSANTLNYGENRPLKVPADWIGELTNTNTITNTFSDSVIEVLGGTISRDASWKNVLPLNILGTVTVKGTDGADSLTTLAIEAGAVLKFLNTQLIIGGTSGDPGALIAQGTAQSPITFTTSNTSPVSGNWYGITFSTTADASSIVDHCIVEYAGYGNYGAVRVQNSSPTISNSTIRNNKYYGIHIINGTPVIFNNSIIDNGNSGIYAQNGTTEITGNTIANSGGHSIYVVAGTPVITDNTLTDGLWTPNNGLAELGGNTFSLNGTQPVRLPVDFVGDLLENNTITDIEPDSYIEVVGGTITKDATWKNIVPLHILANVTVKGTDGSDNITTLTIEPGTTIKMANRIQFIVGGTSGDPGALQAIGSSSSKITFTSADANPAPGKWYGIIFYTTTDSSTTLENCIVEYAGLGSYGGAYTYYSAPTIKDSIFRNNSAYGIRNHYGSPIIDGNTILNNGNYSVYSNAGQISLTNNTMDGGISIPNNGLTNISGNTFDYSQERAIKVPVNWIGELTTNNGFANINAGSVIEVVGGTITHDATWQNVLPLQINGSVTVKGSGGIDSLTTLSLTPGVELRFNTNTQLVIGGTSGDPGALDAQGTAQKRILFTSSHATPSAGNWFGIIIYTTSADHSILDFCTVEYGGKSNYGGVYNYGASATIKNSTFRNNQAYGVRVYTGSPVIQNSIFEDTGGSAIYSQFATPTITGNSFITTTNCGITNATSSIVISAQSNWWGDNSGPLDTIDDTATGGLYNPSALGACVSSYVDYDPWSTVSLVDTDGDGISDMQETTTYGTDPLLFDTDADGIGDGAELTYWGADWNADFDSDGLINLLDSDADGDGTTDGDEIAQGSDPGQMAVTGTIVYEDGEDGHTNGWLIYDDDPTGAFVDNVYDIDKEDRVIEFVGDGLLNGFRLHDELGEQWRNTDHEVIEWSMNFSEDFAISIAVDTPQGLRYLTYTEDDFDALGSGTDVFHGLGTMSRDGTWRTYIIDLGYHLDEAQPGNTITSLLGFYVSGSGKVDDIKTHQDIPAGWDSDGDGLTDNDELFSYDTNPYKFNTDGDALDDGAELSFWGIDWNSDPDGDGLINILDIDSDNNGVNDGL